MSYVLSGYSTPDGVNSREKVKEYQRSLGVTADGIWGPKTQAAYEGSLSSSAAIDPWTGNLDKFSGFYNTILNSMNIPTIQIDVPSKEELSATYSAALRPSTDYAITARREAGETNKAEYDADAAARGMGSSTFVSSMKEREDDDIESDVAYMEAQYTATLADKIASAMQSYAQIEASAAQANASMLFNAQNTAMGLAGQWYSSYINSLANGNAYLGYSSSVSGPSHSGSSKGSAASARLSTDDYLDYVANLSSSQRTGLFSDSSSYWTTRRNELKDALGGQSYNKLVKSYVASGKTTGGYGVWRQATR